MDRLTLRWGGLVRLALLALIWGSSFVWIKVGLRGAPPPTLLALLLRPAECPHPPELASRTAQPTRNSAVVELR